MSTTGTPAHSAAPTPVKVFDGQHSFVHETHKLSLRGLSDDEIRKYELKVTNVLVDHPKKIMACQCVVFVALAIVSFGVIGFELTESDFEDKGDVRTKNIEASNALRERNIPNQPPGKEGDIQPGASTQELRSQALSGFRFVYEAGSGGVMTLERLRFIKETEDRLLRHEDYRLFCLLQWYDKTEDVRAVPWYRSDWEYTKDYDLPDGAKAVCALPTRSISWWLWNSRIVNATTSALCDVDTHFDECVATGTLRLLSYVQDGRTPSERAAEVEAGGREPTQREIDAFLRISVRLRQQTEYAFLRYFFDKDFADPALPDSDPKKWESQFVRSSVVFGGPIEVEDPTKREGIVCHGRATESECKTSSACEWVPYAGRVKGYVGNVTGCATRQQVDVSSVYEAEANENMQEDFGDWFARDITNDIDDLDGPVDVLYVADGTLFDKFISLIIRDSLLALIAFIFVYLYLQIHTGSFFLASFGMLQVMMPFPLAYFMYDLVFGVKAFYGLSTLSLFLVLAIGADDIFVFMDHWEQANECPRDDNCTYMKGRFAHAWKSSGLAMGITSVTTMSAFLATMSAPLFEIKYFGLFAATLVFFDYLLVMTFFACAVVVYHRGSEYTLGCCCCGTQACGAWFNCCTCYTQLLAFDDEAHPSCMQSKLSRRRTHETLEEARQVLGVELDFTPRQQVGEVVNETEPVDPKEVLAQDTTYHRRHRIGLGCLAFAVCAYVVGFVLLSFDHSTSIQQFGVWVLIILAGLFAFSAGMNALSSAISRAEQLGIETSDSNVFSRYFAPFLSGTSGLGRRWYVRLFPAVVLVGVWVLMAYEASQLEKVTKTEQWLPDWHPIQRYIDATFNEFPQSDQEFVHPVVFTIGIDADDPVDRSDWDKWDANSIGDARLYQSSTKLSDYSSESFQRFVIALCDEVLQQSQAGAALQRTMLVEPHLDRNCFMIGFRDYAINRTGAFPVPQGEYVSLLWQYVEQQRDEAARGIIPPQSDIHHDKILFRFDSPTQPPIGVDAMVLTFNTTLKRYGNSNSAIRRWHDAWSDWAEEVSKAQPAWVTNIYGTSFPLGGQLLQGSEVFVWMHTQDVLVSGAITGTLMSLGLAAIVVFIGTLNAWIAVLVLIELFGVVGYVLGMIKVLGWEMGTIESVAVTILVGLSVDYVVHFAIHYRLAEVDGDESVTERQKRVFETVVEMGPTVLGGAATSIGASLVLLLTWVQFFYKFGICFLLTIVFSYIWSMLFFLPVLSVVGPQGEFASIRPLLLKCFPRVFATRAEVMALRASDQHNTEPTK